MRFYVTRCKFVLVRYGVCSSFLRGSCVKVNGRHAGMSSKYSVELVSNGPKNLSLDMQSQAIPWTVLYRFQRLWTKFWTRKPKESPRVSVSWQWEAPWLAWDMSSLRSGSQEFCHWYMREYLITFLYFLKFFFSSFIYICIFLYMSALSSCTPEDI